MLETHFEILSNKKLAPGTYEMILGGAANPTAPGQFIDIKLPGMYLRRPISVCDWTDDTVTIIYKTVGEGTKFMASLREGEMLEALSPLGNGYNISKSGDTPVVIGGGVGAPPVYGLTKALLAAGVTPQVVLGWNTESELFYVDKFNELGVPVTVATADGSFGVHGFVTDALPEKYSYFFACGPEPMLKALYKCTVTSGQLSFEARMGCGFGACMGCSCETLTGYKRICKDGPVMEKEELKW